MKLLDELSTLKIEDQSTLKFEYPITRGPNHRLIEFVSDTEDNEGPAIKKRKKSPKRRAVRQLIIKQRRFQDNTYDFDSGRESSSEDERAGLDPELESAYPWARCLPTHAEREEAREIMRAQRDTMLTKLEAENHAN